MDRHLYHTFQALESEDKPFFLHLHDFFVGYNFPPSTDDEESQ